MDQDIADAADSLALERIRLQLLRDDIAVRRTIAADTTLLASEPVDDTRTRVAMRLLDKYMTPSSTATTDAGMATDASNDAKRLKAAIDAVMATVFPG